MSRRMIDPQVIIKTQIINDKFSVDLYELLEKYGVQHTANDKNVTLQIYFKETWDDGTPQISANGISKGIVAINTAITISEFDGDVIIGGLIFDNSFTNFLGYTKIDDGDYENGILLTSPFEFDIHVIKV